MKSGHIVILLLVIFIAGVSVLAVFIWQTKHAEETRLLNEQLQTRYEATIDSLEGRIKILETRAAVSGSLGDTTFLNMLFDEIDFLRRQVNVIVDSAIRYSGSDSVTFFIHKLGDSTFVSHYGDYDQPKTWYIAPEGLGMMGRPAIAPLVQILDTSSGFVLSQALYALQLASQHRSVTQVTGGEMPDAEYLEGNSAAAVLAWKEWARKYNLAGH